MMVPRSYLLHQASSPPPSSSRSPSDKRMGVRSPRIMPTPPAAAAPRLKLSQPHTRTRPDPNMRAPASEAKSETAVTVTPIPQSHAHSHSHSKPVVIPPRTPTAAPAATQSVRVRGHNGGRLRTPKNHRADAVPPAVAALLAVTEIPRMPTRRRKGSTRDRRISMDELIREWRQDESELPSSVVGSPLDLLLGRVDESEDEYGSLRSLEQEKESMTSRSISSDSILTVPPSLDLDAPSFVSNWDGLSTPESYSRSERREKVVQSPPKEECVLDHPLLHFDPDDCDDMASLQVPDIVTTSSSPPASSARFKSFKSNLTASIQALKEAAKSFSNFTAPSVPPDDFLTRSLLSPRFTSEMRPKHLEGVPSPELRRYLNPQSPSKPSISAAELSMHLHDSLALDPDSENASAPMIQMQTYDRRGRARKSRAAGKASDPFSEAGRALSPSPAVRQREPRENSDFLRVIVLEMNMRRVGKLDARAVGRARIWLPPRKLGERGVAAGVDGEKVPVRWVGCRVDEV